MFKNINESFDKKFKQITEDTSDEYRVVDGYGPYMNKRCEVQKKYSYYKDKENGRVDAYHTVYHSKDKEDCERVMKNYKTNPHKKRPTVSANVWVDESKSLKESPVYDLVPSYDSRQSFYNKARVDIKGEEQTLYSYNTPVTRIVSGKVELLPKWDFSSTTLRHVKEFLKQNGFEKMSKFEMQKNKRKGEK